MYFCVAVAYDILYFTNEVILFEIYQCNFLNKKKYFACRKQSNKFLSHLKELLVIIKQQKLRVIQFS